ncbi:hypothetical protein D3C87_1861310 [compost metagenome]
MASTWPGMTRSPAEASIFSMRAGALVATVKVSASTMPCTCGGAGRAARNRPTMTKISTANAARAMSSVLIGGPLRRRGEGGTGSVAGAVSVMGRSPGRRVADS